MNQNKFENSKENLYVGLGSTSDFSRWESFSTNALIQEINKPNSLVYFEVASLKEAAKMVRDFIDEFGLTSSNWVGGNVLDSSLKYIASISYNGRIWDNEDWKIAKEIVL